MFFMYSRAAQQGRNPCQQFAHLERLGQVIICPPVEAFKFILRRGV
jgi:hypothetical protein